MTQAAVSSDLALEITNKCGENVFLCYQCQKCSSGCPVAEYFDLAPNQLMRALQFGQRDLVLRSKTIWLCAMCETCAVRCPHDINITKIMDVLKITAQEEGIPCPVPSVTYFNQAAMRGVRWFGKMYEAGLMGEIYLRQMMAGTLDTKQLVKNDLPLALKMVKNRKLKLLPSTGAPRFSKSAGETKEAIGYYPGCSLHGTAREYNASTLAVFNRLGVKLEEPRDWSCCGSTPAHSTDHYAAVLHPAKNIVAMEQKGFRRITTPCPSCFLRLRSGAKESGREDVRERLLRDIHELPSPEVKIDHLLTTVALDVGLERVAEQVRRPLNGLKVACYYGCIITRPPKITKVPDYEYPMQMDNLMKSLGADPLSWSYKTRCCGGSLAVSQLPITLALTKKILQNAKDVGARAVVVACPLCQVNLDARQKQLTEDAKEAFDLPIIYFTQLMGLAFGLEPKVLELNRHFVDSGAIINNLHKAQNTN